MLPIFRPPFSSFSFRGWMTGQARGCIESGFENDRIAKERKGMTLQEALSRKTRLWFCQSMKKTDGRPSGRCAARPGPALDGGRRIHWGFSLPALGSLGHSASRCSGGSMLRRRVPGRSRQGPRRRGRSNWLRRTDLRRPAGARRFVTDLAWSDPGKISKTRPIASRRTSAPTDLNLQVDRSNSRRGPFHGRRRGRPHQIEFAS